MYQKHNLGRRIVSMMLALLMVFALMPAGVFADDIAVQNGEAITQAAETAETLAEEPAATPVEEPVATPAEQPVAPPTEEPATPPAEQPVTPPTEEPVAPPTEEPVTPPAVRTLTVGYFFTGSLTSALAGTQAAQPYVATLAEGATYNVQSPAVAGFAPNVAVCTGTVGTENITLTVVYSPADANYTVHHMRQNVSGSGYELYKTEKSTGKTGDLTVATAKNDEGFVPKAFEQAEIAADGSTFIEIYYDRTVHFVKYSTNGGEYVDTVSARYGETVSIAGGTTKTGYKFAGWYLDEACTKKAGATVAMKDADITLYAKFTEEKEVAYTAVYLQESLTAGQYDFKEKEVLYAPIGAQIDVKNGKIIETVKTTVTTEKSVPSYNYFTHQKVDKATVSADGSTVVNIYYARNSYTFSFDLDKDSSKVKLTIGGKTYTGNGDPYTFSAKLGEDVASRWPTVDNIVNNKDSEQFQGWSGPTRSLNVSKRFNIVPELIDNGSGEAQNNATIDYSGSWEEETEKVELHYMLQNAADDLYTDSPLYRQSANTTGSFNAKDIDGFKWKNTETKNIDRITHYYFYYTRLSSTINFDTRGGAPAKIDAITARFEAPITAPTPPTKPGYTFGGWCAGDSTCSGTPFTFSTMPFNNVILYAKWIPRQYTVTFDAKGGAAVAAQTVNYRTPLNESATLTTKNGYTFGGWYTTAEFTGTPYVFDKPVESNFTLYARWYVKSTATVNITHTPTDGSAAFAGKNTTLTGQTVTGTVTAQAVLVEKYAPDAVSKSIVVDADDTKNTINFQYTPFESLSYTVQYVDANGKQLLPAESRTQTGLARATENYKQIAGYTPDAYQKTLVLVADTTKNVIIFHYAPLKKVEYTVAHYVQKSDNSYERKDAQTLSAAPGTPVSFTPKNYEGHAYNQALSTPAAVVTSDGKTELKFYYDWIYYHVTYDLNGATGSVTDANSYRHGTDVTLKAITGVTPPPHTNFAGWKLGSTLYKADDKVKNITANITCVAQWNPKAQYKLTYRCADNKDLAAGTFYSDENITTKEFADTGFALPENKKFVFWTDENKQTYTPGTQIMLRSDKVLTAHLVDKKNIVITYEGNGGKIGEDVVVIDATRYEGAIYKILENMFTYPGYKFTGWKGGIAGTNVTLEKHITLTAQWEKDEDAWVTLTYHANDGEGKLPDPVETLKGEDVIVAEATELTREKSILLGWSESQISFFTRNRSIPDLILPGEVFTLEDHTILYAVWTQDQDEDGTPDDEEFIVTYHGNGNNDGTVPVDAHLYSGKEGDDTATVLGRADLAKTNAAFLGWSLEEYALIKTQEEENAAHILSAGNTVRITEADVNLYAVWALDENGPDKKPDGIADYKEFAVTYYANNGTNKFVSNGAIYPAGYTVTLAENLFAREGYTFGTWNAQADGKGTAAKPQHTFAIERNTEFYAQWNKIPAIVPPTTTPTPEPEQPVVLAATTPRTGDSAPVFSLAASMAMALAAFCVLAVWRKRTSL